MFYHNGKYREAGSTLSLVSTPTAQLALPIIRPVGDFPITEVHQIHLHLGSNRGLHTNTCRNSLCTPTATDRRCVIRDKEGKDSHNVLRRLRNALAPVAQKCTS